MQRVPQELERVTLRDARPGHTGDGRRVQLLEVRDRLRNDRGLDVRNRARRNQRSIAGAQVIVEHLGRVEAVDLQDLWDNLVGAALDREVVDVAAAEGRTERAPDALLREADVSDHVPVEN